MRKYRKIINETIMQYELVLRNKTWDYVYKDNTINKLN
jgi:hypothetical protein